MVSAVSNCFRFLLLKMYERRPGVVLVLLREVRRILGSGFNPGVKVEIERLENFFNSYDSIICFDIGANSGEYALALKTKFPQSIIHSFEPSLSAFQRLTTSVSESLNIHPHNIGFSNMEGSFNLYGDKLGGELASLHLRDVHAGSDSLPSVELSKFTTLDAWMTNFSVIPHFCKIDTEGSEYDVLERAEILFQNSCIIQFEFGGTQIDSRHFFKDYFSLFDKHNYLILKLIPSGFFPVFQYNVDFEDFGYANFLAVPRDNLKLNDLLDQLKC